MKIGIASDHRGYKIKEMLKDYLDNVYEVVDYGTDSDESTDFPIYAKKLGKGIQKKEVDLGIAICGTGIGMSICLNKMKGIYCAKVSNESEAILCKSHNNANVIALSEEVGDDNGLLINPDASELARILDNLDSYDWKALQYFTSYLGVFIVVT